MGSKFKFGIILYPMSLKWQRNSFEKEESNSFMVPYICQPLTDMIRKKRFSRTNFKRLPLTEIPSHVRLVHYSITAADALQDNLRPLISLGSFLIILIRNPKPNQGR